MALFENWLLLCIFENLSTHPDGHLFYVENCAVYVAAVWCSDPVPTQKCTFPEYAFWYVGLKLFCPGGTHRFTIK